MRRFLQRLFDPVDLSFLVLFRILFGTVFAVHAVKLLLSGYVENELAALEIRFTYLAFPWVKPFPGDGTYYEFYAIALLGAFVALGLFYRVSIVLLTALWTHVFLLEETIYQNHYYLLCLVGGLLCFMPANRAFSLDARWGLCRPSNRVPRWMHELLRFQIGVPYVFGAIAKLNPDWLSGVPMKWMLYFETGRKYVGPYFEKPLVMFFFTYGGILFDGLIVPALIWRKTRPWAIAAAISFHVINSQLFTIDVFPWFMIGALPLFFEPDWMRRAVHRLRGLPAPPPPEPPGTTPLLRRHTAIAAAVGLYALIQVLVPFRHFLYPGNVDWTREGGDFAWRMKLNVLQAQNIFFRVRDTVTGEAFDVTPNQFLSFHQSRIIPHEPEMILHMAHDIADAYYEARGSPAQVFASIEISLNGRPFQPFVNRDMDLAAEHRSFRPYDWIVPLRIGVGEQMKPPPLKAFGNLEKQYWNPEHNEWYDLPGAKGIDPAGDALRIQAELERRFGPVRDFHFLTEGRTNHFDFFLDGVGDYRGWFRGSIEGGEVNIMPRPES